MVLDKMIEVLTAYRDGAKIQKRFGRNESWQDFDPSKDVWDFVGYRYRVVPEPLEGWGIVHLSRPSVIWRVFDSKDAAISACSSNARVVHLREVSDD